MNEKTEQTVLEQTTEPLTIDSLTNALRRVEYSRARPSSFIPACVRSDWLWAVLKLIFSHC